VKSPREDLPPPQAARRQEDFSRRAQTTHQLVMGNRLALPCPVTRQSLIENPSMLLRHGHLLLIRHRKPQALSDFQPLALWEPEKGRKGIGGHERSVRTDFASASQRFCRTSKVSRDDGWRAACDQPSVGPAKEGNLPFLIPWGQFEVSFISTRREKTLLPFREQKRSSGFQRTSNSETRRSQSPANMNPRTHLFRFRMLPDAI
jgi:hypothetical protein